MAKPLTPQQSLFVREYLKDLNAKQAAIRAGYSKKTAKQQGSRLLTDVDVQAAIAAGTEKKAERAEISAAYVLKTLQEVAERCMQKAPVMEFDHEAKEMRQAVDEDGKDIWEFNANGANKALELLGKHLALFTEKHAHTHSFEDMPDEALQAKYDAAVAKASSVSATRIPEGGE